MKKLLALVTIIFALSAAAQKPKDTSAPRVHDTLIGYVRERYDTQTVDRIKYLRGSRVRECSPGYIVYKSMVVTFDQGRTWKYFGGQPQPFQALDNKRKPVKLLQ